MAGDMNIEEFVEEALIQISRGVLNAKNRSFEQNGIPIAPAQLNDELARHGDKDVDFELQVAVTNSASGRLHAQSKGALKILAADVDGAGELSREKAVVQKISFSVPMHFNASWTKEIK